MKPRTGLRFAVLALLCLALAVTALAQDFRGGVTGRVTDSSGGVLPGVTVTVTNVETRVPSVVVTDSKGYYQVLHLNSGTYTVEAKLEGFKPVERKGITVHVGDALKIDFALQPGSMEETVVVTAASPILDTTPVSGNVVDRAQIH